MKDEKQKVTNVHDDFFNGIMKNKQNATDFLSGALPAEIVNQIDFTNIEYDDTGYGGKYISDLVVKLKIADKPLDIYILLEHKSTQPNKNDLFLQILKYIYAMLEQDNKNKNDFRVIIPLVFYHGKDKWDIPQQFLELYRVNDVNDVNDDIKKYMLDFSYILYDTDNFNDDNDADKFHKNLILLSSLIAFKNTFSKGDFKTIQKIFNNLNELGLLEHVSKAEVFITYVAQTKQANVDEVISLISDISQDGGKEMLTFADYFTTQGMEQGMQQGMQQGMEQGMQRGVQREKIEIATNLLKLGIDIKTVSIASGLPIDEVEKLN